MLHITQAEKDVCYILQRLRKIHVTYKQAGKNAC